MTVATVPEMARVSARALVATVKIIPYAVPRYFVEAAASNPALSLAPFTVQTASLILTKTEGMSEKLLSKGKDAVEHRLQSYSCALNDVVTVTHEIATLADAIRSTSGDIVLILTGSATSDINDVGPSALVASGREVTRFGMPVDPGNLLFLGHYDGRPVIGLPGCARSPPR